MANEEIDPADLPYRFERQDHVVITMTDKTRLDARLWLPTHSALGDKVATILEFIPYRKDDWTWGRDHKRHRFFAGEGYAVLRPDMRGSGDSEGVLEGEYLPQEQKDCLEIMEWIEKQPWSDGSVVMYGKSWGGFNGLQVAALRPRQLKGVISLYSTDDRYGDDIHYYGGCLLASDHINWGNIMLAWNSRSPHPEHFLAEKGQDWETAWRNRLEKTPFYLEEWLDHPTRDDFWKHGSICEDYSSIQCPVFLIGGWADGYTNAAFRMQKHFSEKKSCESKLLVGPWSHDWPDQVQPGPCVGYLQECLKFLGEVVGGKATGWSSEPDTRVFVQHHIKPSPVIKSRPGSWVATSCVGDSTTKYQLLENGLEKGWVEVLDSWTKIIPGTQSSGMTCGSWMSYGRQWEFAPDQTREDASWLCLDSDIFDEDAVFVGFPELSLSLQSSKPRALIAARLCDVAPDGSSLILTKGILNLCHRDSHETPSFLVEGKWYDVSLTLDVLGVKVEKGHKIRLALSSTCWPFAWPSAENVTLKLKGGCLSLPTCTHTDAAQVIEPPLRCPALPTKVIREPSSSKSISFDFESELWTLKITEDDGRSVILETDECMDERATDTWHIRDDDPLSAVAESTRETSIVWAGREPGTSFAKSRLTCTKDTFELTSELKVQVADRVIFEKKSTKSFPRQFQ